MRYSIFSASKSQNVIFPVFLTHKVHFLAMKKGALGRGLEMKGRKKRFMLWIYDFRSIVLATLVFVRRHYADDVSFQTAIRFEVSRI